MSQIDRSLAQAARAWPFEEARKLVARTGGKVPAKGYRAARNRLRPVRPAAYRHVRRGRAHHHGAPGLQAPERYPDAAVLLLRRHGRAAQGARQRAQQGDAGGPSRQAAHRRCPIRSATSIRASARPTTRGCAPSSIPSASSTSSSRRPIGTSRAASTRCCSPMLQHYDEVQAVMLPTLGEERQQTYSIFLPISPKTGRVLQVPVVKTDAAAGHHRLSRRGRHLGRDAGHRRQRQAAVEGRLGRPLVRARRRLRDVRQGSHPVGRIERQDRPHPGRQAARGLQLRALPRRAGPQDLQVQGQRALGRGMAALCAARIAGALHAAAAASGQAALFRRHPARRRRLSRGDREAAGRGAGQGAGERGLAHP